MNMKSSIHQLFLVLLAICFMTSCKDEWGTEPGNDSNPVATVYQYKPVRPYDADNDVIFRVATNNKTTEAYYLVEKTANISMSESDYMNHVVATGTKINDISGESNVDLTITGLTGDNTITVVAVGNGKKTSLKATFVGLEWNDVVEGTYYFAQANIRNTIGASSVHTTLQVCTTNSKQFRFKEIFGTGYSMKINLLELKDADEDGEYTFFRVPVADTPYTYTINPANTGPMSVRDVGYWQGNDAYVTDYGYESGMYEDYFCFVAVQYFVVGGLSIGWNYDMFEPD